MTTPPAKPEAHIDDLRPMTVEEEAEIDAWTARNKDALDASIRKSREDYARGRFHTQEQVDAELAARRLRRLQKKT
ncbi:MAG: hypothetical protein WDM81_04550 [Rhizomicrobium sp.]